MGRRPALVRRSVGWSDDERQAFAPLHRTRGSHNRQAAFAPAPPDAPTRFASAQWLLACQFLLGHRQLDRLPPTWPDATPRSIRYKRGIHERVTGSMSASFMESVV